MPFVTSPLAPGCVRFSHFSKRFCKQKPSRSLSFSGSLLAVWRRTLFLEMTCKANFANEGPSLNCTDSAKRLCSQLVNRGSCSKIKADQTLETAVLRQL